MARSTLFCTGALTLLSIVVLSGARAQTTVVPNANSATSGGARVLIDGAVTYQMQLAASQLGGINVGDSITGLTFRICSLAGFNGSSAAASFINFDVTLAQASNPIGSMSTTFANNLTSPVLVRSGGLAFSAGDFTGGATAPVVNPWGPTISFSTPFTYSGGDLIVQISHGAGSAPLGSMDAINSLAPSYGTLFRAVTATGYNSTIGAGNQAFTVLQLRSQAASSAAPEPGTALLLLMGSLTFLRYRRLV